MKVTQVDNRRQRRAIAARRQAPSVDLLPSLRAKSNYLQRIQTARLARYLGRKEWNGIPALDIFHTTEEPRSYMGPGGIKSLFNYAICWQVPRGSNRAAALNEVRTRIRHNLTCVR